MSGHPLGRIKLKWSSHENGTILNDPILSPNSNLKFEDTKMKIICQHENHQNSHYRNSDDEHDDETNESETSRLHDEENDTSALFPNYRSTFNIYKGILYSSLSSLFFSLSSVIVKYLEASLIRIITGLIFFICF